MTEILCGILVEFPQRFDGLAVGNHGSFDLYVLIIPRPDGLVKWSLYELVATPVVLDENLLALLNVVGSKDLKSMSLRVSISFVSLLISTSA